MLCIENAVGSDIVLIELGVLCVNVVDSVAELADSGNRLDSLPDKMGGVEVCADGIAYSLSQLEKSFGIVAAEAIGPRLS